MSTANNQVNNADVNTNNNKKPVQKPQRYRRKPHPCQVLSRSLYRFRHEFPESWFIQGRQRVDGHKDWFFYPPATDPEEPREEIRSRRKAKLYLLEEEKKARELLAKNEETGQGEGFSSLPDENKGKEIVLNSPPPSTERNDYWKEVHTLENSTSTRWNSEHDISTSRRKNWKNMARNACEDSDCEINGDDSAIGHTSRRKRWKNMARNVCKDSDSETNKSHLQGSAKE